MMFHYEKTTFFGVRLQRVAQTGTPFAAGAAASRMAVVDEHGLYTVIQLHQSEILPTMEMDHALRSWLVLVMSSPTLFTQSTPATCPSRTDCGVEGLSRYIDELALQRSTANSSASETRPSGKAWSGESQQVAVFGSLQLDGP